MSKFEQNVKTFFKEADLDGSGCLSNLELYKVLLKSGFGGTAYDAQCWFDSIDVDCNKKITLEELLKQLSLRDPKSVQESELRAWFKEYDKDGSGYITVDELQVVMDKCGRPGDAKKLMSGGDRDKDGKLNIEEVIKMWNEPN
ncbi:hypothetical protein BsWGS_12152 [Bradybaena similaris]